MESNFSFLRFGSVPLFLLPIAIDKNNKCALSASVPSGLGGLGKPITDISYRYGFCMRDSSGNPFLIFLPCAAWGMPRLFAIKYFPYRHGSCPHEPFPSPQKINTISRISLFFWKAISVFFGLVLPRCSSCR